MRTHYPPQKLSAGVAMVLSLLALTGCAGVSDPPTPLWDPALYETVAVLPVRMTVLTGRHPFEAEDTDLSFRTGALMQKSLSIAMRMKGYEVLAPEDLSERLMVEDDLSEAFVALASAHGFMGDDTGTPLDEAMAGAARIGEKLGADLLILAHGSGEYYGRESALYEGLFTGLLSHRDDHRPPPISFLKVEVFFVDQTAGVRVARIPPSSIPFEKSLAPLTRRINGLIRRVPEKAPSGPAGPAP